MEFISTLLCCFNSILGELTWVCFEDHVLKLEQPCKNKSLMKCKCFNFMWLRCTWVTQILLWKMNHFGLINIIWCQRKIDLEYILWVPNAEESKKWQKMKLDGFLKHWCLGQIAIQHWIVEPSQQLYQV